MQADVTVWNVSLSRFDDNIELVLRYRRVGRSCFYLQIHRIQRVGVKLCFVLRFLPHLASSRDQCNMQCYLLFAIRVCMSAMPSNASKCSEHTTTILYLRMAPHVA